MIKFIAAIDSQRGLADDQGIPWAGRIPKEVAYFRQKTMGGIVIMGYTAYARRHKPLEGRRNLVATTKDEPLRPGFEKVADARAFLENTKEDIWVGSTALFSSTLDLADELYLTLLDGDFGCTKFFPPYEDRFTMVSQSQPMTENGITYRYTIWRRKQLPKQG